MVHIGIQALSIIFKSGRGAGSSKKNLDKQKQSKFHNCENPNPWGGGGGLVLKTSISLFSSLISL